MKRFLNEFDFLAFFGQLFAGLAMVAIAVSLILSYA